MYVAPGLLYSSSPSGQQFPQHCAITNMQRILYVAENLASCFPPAHLRVWELTTVFCFHSSVSCQVTRGHQALYFMFPRQEYQIW